MIIDEKKLLEDVIEGVSNYLERELTSDEIEEYLDDYEMSWIIDEMFEAESECIVKIAEKITSIKEIL